jgi:hypothetical protein
MRAWVLLASALAAGCSGQMSDQPRYEPLERSSFFSDGRSARRPVAGTVARGSLREDALLHTGAEGGKTSGRLPFPATRELLERGRERYGIHCAVCHGEAGYGDGMIVRRGFPTPPSFHDARLREAPVGHYFQVATEGFGAMMPYAARVSVRDRWAIAAYIRALQRSQYAALADVEPSERRRLEAER